MNGEAAAAGLGEHVDEPVEKRIVVAVVDTDAGLHGDRDRDRVIHRAPAVGDGLGLGHQAGAECALLHAVARAADVDVDRVVAGALGQHRRLAHQFRLAAADLQHDRVLLGVECQQPIGIAVHQRGRRDHLGVEHGGRRQQTVEKPAVPVRPVHHRRNGERYLVHASSLASGPVGSTGGATQAGRVDRGRRYRPVHDPGRVASRI